MAVGAERIVGGLFTADPTAQATAASKSFQPSAVNDAAAVSSMKKPTRRAGATSPGMTAFLSYPKMTILAASPASVAIWAALAFGRPQHIDWAALVTLTVPDSPAASGCVELIIVALGTLFSLGGDGLYFHNV